MPQYSTINPLASLPLLPFDPLPRLRPTSPKKQPPNPPPNNPNHKHNPHNNPCQLQYSNSITTLRHPRESPHTPLEIGSHTAERFIGVVEYCLVPRVVVDV